METLANQPANADNTAQVETTKPDGEAVETNGDGSAPSAPEAGSPATKVKDPVQERFDKLTRDKYDALRDGDRKGYLLEQRDRELADLRAKLEAREDKQVAPANDFPTLEQYGYDEAKFAAAIIAYNKATLDAAKTAGRESAQEELRRDRENQAVELANKSWATKEAEFVKSKPDYAEKVIEGGKRGAWGCTPEMAQIIKQSEFGPAMALHLAENAEKSFAIAKMPPLDQARELGRIEARFEAAKASPPPPVSQAPSPVSKVDGGDAPVSVKVDSADSDKLSDQEWTRRRNAQEQARLKKLRG